MCPRSTTVDLSALAHELFERIRFGSPVRAVEFRVASDVMVHGDPVLLRAALESLRSNALKYGAKRELARIEFGRLPRADGNDELFVRDNGAGFDMAQADKLFTAFKRLHTPSRLPKKSEFG